jgi:dUTP pyrophosphatase
MNDIEIKIVNTSKNPLPTYSKDGDACVDLRAVIEPNSISNLANAAMHNGSLLIYPDGRALIGTGLHIQFPRGYMFKIQERSGLGADGIKVSGGVVDSNYTGEIKIALLNTSSNVFSVNYGDRIAQGCLIPIPHMVFKEVDTLDETNRGSDGFNSTGVK